MKLFRLVPALLIACGIPTLHAVNIIQNGSFEDTNITLVSGNNLNVTVPSWNITDSSNVDPNPTNLVFPAAGYNGGPDVAQDGVVYFDGNGTDVVLFQDFNITVDQTVTFSAYFSRRDSLDALGNKVDIYDSTGTTLLGSSTLVDIPANLSQEDWYLSAGSLDLTAGSYRLQIALENDANIDNVVLNAIPEPSGVSLIGLAGVGLFMARRRFTGRKFSV